MSSQHVPQRILLEIHLPCQPQKSNKGNHQLVRFLGTQLQIRHEILRDGSLGELGDGGWRIADKNSILHQFLNILFLGCFEQQLQTLPVHCFIKRFLNMAESNYNPRPPYYYYPQDNQNFQPSTSQLRHQQDVFTPTHSRLSNIELSNTQFVPKIIESGYIVGPPIAYTQGPSLPANFNAFSPSKQNLPLLIDSSHPNSNSKLIINNPVPHYIPVSTTEIKSTPINQPSIIIHSPHKAEETVPKSQYDRCYNECKNWETKYNELYLRYTNSISGQNQSNELQDENRRLRQRIRQLQMRERSDSQSSKSIKQLIERYKESTLKECFLLLDRYRLECKQRE